MPDFLSLLHQLLIPFAIAVPIGLLVMFFNSRRSKEEEVEDIAPSSLDSVNSRSPTLAQAPSSVAGSLSAQDLDLVLGATTKFQAPTVAERPSHGVTVSPGGAIDLPLGNSVKTHLPDAPRDVARDAAMPPDTIIDETLLRPKARLLVVDDSAVPRAKLKKLFEAQGYEVETAADGVLAMEALGKSRFSVIITDLEMPNMDGFELIAAIQGSLETEDIPVIAITGHDEMQARVHNIQGLYGIFKKPWNDRELLKRIEVLASLKK